MEAIFHVIQTHGNDFNFLDYFLVEVVCHNLKMKQLKGHIITMWWFFQVFLNLAPTSCSTSLKDLYTNVTFPQGKKVIAKKTQHVNSTSKALIVPKSTVVSQLTV